MVISKTLFMCFKTDNCHLRRHCSQDVVMSLAQVCQKREKYMQDAKRLARSSEATENARGSGGTPPSEKLCN